MKQIMLDVCLMVEIAVKPILILYFAMNAYAMNKQNTYHLMERLVPTYERSSLLPTRFTVY